MAPSHDAADDYKKQGNKCFQLQRYQDAIDAYSKAISKNPNVAAFYTNRALCFINTKLWPQVVHDCQKAIELDRNSVKAYYFWGRASLKMENYDEAIRLLAKAQELVQGQQIHFGDEIHSQLREARRGKFQREENIRLEQEIELQSYLEKLIEDDMKRRIACLSMEEREGDGPATIISQEAQTYKTQLNALFTQVDDRRRRREIPDYLCGKISFELMRDPVITPSGITYDRQDIREHLQRVGHFDPVSRAPLDESKLIPNLVMKEVIDQFLTENEWAEHDET